MTIVSVKSATGLNVTKNVYCALKCESQKVKTELSISNGPVAWDDNFVFYRKSPDKPIMIKVRSSEA